MEVLAGRREVDGAAAEVGEANARVHATPLLLAVGEVEVVAMPPLHEVKRVGEVEAAAQQGDPTKTTQTSPKGQKGEMAVVRPIDQSSSSLRTFLLCMHNAKRPGTRSMRRDVAAPR